MHKLAPLTKLILTVAVSVWALMLQTLPALGLLVLVQVVLLAIADASRKTIKTVGGLGIFATLLALMQVAFGMDYITSIAIGLRMIAMPLVFILLLATTRMQDLTASLVKQCHIPYEYAFMFTAALRFIPDFLAESKAVREAQACRGYTARGNIVKRLKSYVAIVGPLVLKAVTRSETMAVSLELRGFGARNSRSFAANIALTVGDYLLLAAMVLITAGLIFIKF